MKEYQKMLKNVNNSKMSENFQNVKKLLQNVKKCLKTLIFKNVMDRRTNGWMD